MSKKHICIIIFLFLFSVSCEVNHRNQIQSKTNCFGIENDPDCFCSEGLERKPNLYFTNSDNGSQVDNYMYYCVNSSCPFEAQFSLNGTCVHRCPENYIPLQISNKTSSGIPLCLIKDNDSFVDCNELKNYQNCSCHKGWKREEGFGGPSCVEESSCKDWVIEENDTITCVEECPPGYLSQLIFDAGNAGYCEKIEWLNDTYDYQLFLNSFEWNLSFFKKNSYCKELRNVETEDRFKATFWCQDSEYLCNLTVYRNTTYEEGKCNHNLTKDEMDDFGIKYY